MIDVQKRLDNLSPEIRELAEALRNVDSRVFDAQPTMAAKEEALAEVGRMLDDFEAASRKPFETALKYRKYIFKYSRSSC